MKRFLILLVVFALVFSLAGCAAKKPVIDPPEGYVVSSREEIRPNDETAETLLGDWETLPGSLQELAGRSDAAVKVRLTAREKRDPQTEKYEFALLKDYFGTAKDPIVLYSRSSDFFEPGGVYYLFLTYRDLPVSPLRSYGLASSAFAVREYWLDGGAVLDFRAGFSLGLTGDTDMDKTLRELAASMAEEGTLPTPDTRTLEDRLEAAGLVEIVTVTELRPEAGGPGEYYTFADFAVDEVLHGKTLIVPDGAPMMVPIDARAGDRFVLVFGPGAKSPGETADYRVYAIDSEEAQTVLEYFGAEVSPTTEPTAEPTVEPTPAPELTEDWQNAFADFIEQRIFEYEPGYARNALALDLRDFNGDGIPETLLFTEGGVVAHGLEIYVWEDGELRALSENDANGLPTAVNAVPYVFSANPWNMGGYDENRPTLHLLDDCWILETHEAAWPDYSFYAWYELGADADGRLLCEELISWEVRGRRDSLGNYIQTGWVLRGEEVTREELEAARDSFDPGYADKTEYIFRWDGVERRRGEIGDTDLQKFANDFRGLLASWDPATPVTIVTEFDPSIPRD